MHSVWPELYAVHLLVLSEFPLLYIKISDSIQIQAGKSKTPLQQSVPVFNLFFLWWENLLQLRLNIILALIEISQISAHQRILITQLSVLFSFPFLKLFWGHLLYFLLTVLYLSNFFGLRFNQCYIIKWVCFF